MNVYVYLLEAMADWEIGYLTAELNSKRFFKKDAPQLVFKTVGVTRNPVKSMGGITMIPDITIDDIEADENSILILPGADTWANPANKAIVEVAQKIILSKGLVCGICGATVALANEGMLDTIPHTSNGAGFLEMFSANYKGSSFYRNEKAVETEYVITAGATSPLEWAYLILKRLGVFNTESLEAWHEYFSSGSAESFYRLMNSCKA